MFMPPPPAQRFPENTQITGVQPVNIFAEANNVLHRCEGPEYQLVLGEGVYTLRDELILAQPPPHPSEVTVPSNNPLETSTDPITVGPALSIVVAAVSKSDKLDLRAHSRSSIDAQALNEEPPPSQRLSGTSAELDKPPISRPVFGKDNPSLVVSVPKDGKKRKPKNNIVKHSSSFVSRVMPADSLQKKLNDRDSSGLMAFVNLNRSLQWLDLSAERKQDYMTKLYFTRAHVICHDVNALTKSTSHLDVLFGFNSSDIVWYEPISQKYARLNKNGVVNATPVMAIRWLPNSENMFVAAHGDGTLIVYDKEREDAAFVSDETSTQFSSNETRAFDVKKSVQSPIQKTNPVAVWSISHQVPNALAFSPDETHLAVVCEDGTLRVINFLTEKLLDVFRSYYGGLTAVDWSPDGNYILTGGQDDLVCIWSFADRSLVARCQGHSSWLTDVKFDPWRCDERGYRFGSVGQDCRLLLWDFSIGMLRRPKAVSVRHRNSVASASVHRREPIEERLSDENDVFHAVESRSNTAVLPPIMSKKVGDQPLTSLAFTEKCIITIGQEGHVRTWDRPVHGVPEEGMI